MLLAGDVVKGKSPGAVWRSAGLAMCVALNVEGMNSDKSIQAK